MPDLAWNLREQRRVYLRVDVTVACELLMRSRLLGIALITTVTEIVQWGFEGHNDINGDWTNRFENQLYASISRKDALKKCNWRNCEHEGMPPVFLRFSVYGLPSIEGRTSSLLVMPSTPDFFLHTPTMLLIPRKECCRWRSQLK